MRNTLSIVVLLALTLYLQCSLVTSHGYLQAPFQPRNVVNSHYCPQCANGDGACGENNQWPAGADASDLIGSYTTPINTIDGGQSIEFAFQLTAAHQGHFVMELCRPTGTKITHDCFTTRLQRDPTDTRYSPYDPRYPELAIFQANNCALASLQKVRFLIPSDFGDCDHCVLRWAWQTGNSCSSHPATSQSGATEALCQWKSVDGCGITITNSSLCGDSCPTPRCSGERFNNCVDVKVTNSGSPPPTPITTSTSSPQPIPTQSTDSNCPSMSSEVAAKVKEALTLLDDIVSGRAH